MNKCKLPPYTFVENGNPEVFRYLRSFSENTNPHRHVGNSSSPIGINEHGQIKYPNDLSSSEERAKVKVITLSEFRELIAKPIEVNQYPIF